MHTAHGILIDDPKTKIKDQCYKIEKKPDGTYSFKAHIRDATRHLDLNALSHLQLPPKLSHLATVKYLETLFFSITNGITQRGLIEDGLTDVMTVETTIDEDFNFGEISIYRSALANTIEYNFDDVEKRIVDPKHPHLTQPQNLAKMFIDNVSYAFWARRYPMFYRSENMAKISEDLFEDGKTSASLNGEELAEVLSVLTNVIVGTFMERNAQMALFRDNTFDMVSQKVGGLKMSDNKVAEKINKLKHQNHLSAEKVHGDIKHFGLPYVNVTTAFHSRESLINQLLVTRFVQNIEDCVPNETVPHLVKAMNRRHALKGKQDYPRS